jgi:hypothetical protein
MHGFITGGAPERARNFRGAPWPFRIPACPSHLIQHEMLHTSDIGFARQHLFLTAELSVEQSLCQI